MTDKIIQLTFPFVRIAPSPPKQRVQYDSDLNDSQTKRRRLREESDISEIVQHTIQAHLQAMYDKARAREEANHSGSESEEEGKGKAS
jgi:hypothetical protein